VTRSFTLSTQTKTNAGRTEQMIALLTKRSWSQIHYDAHYQPI